MTIGCCSEPDICVTGTPVPMPQWLRSDFLDRAMWEAGRESSALSDGPAVMTATDLGADSPRHRRRARRTILVVTLVAGLFGGVAYPFGVYAGARHLVKRVLGLGEPDAPSTGVTLRVLPFKASASSPDDAIMAGWGDNGVELRDADTGAVRQLLRLAVSVVPGRRSSRAMAYAPDGSTVAAALADGQTIQIWDARTGASRSVLTLPVGGSGLLPLRVSELVYSPDSRTLAVTGDHLHLWDVDTGVLRHRIDVAAQAAAFAPDGTTIAAVANDQGGVWEVATGVRVHPLNPEGGWFWWRVSFAPDGGTVITDGDRLRAWDAATGALRWAGDQGAKPVYAPDGKLVAVTDRDSVWLCDPVNGKRLRELPGLTGLLVWGGNYQQVAGVAWAPDSRTLAVSHAGGNESWNNTPQVWDVESGTALQVLKGHSGRVSRIAYASHGRTITTVADDGTTRIWQTATA
jgi:WD40 repeat protein